MMESNRVNNEAIFVVKLDISLIILNKYGRNGSMGPALMNESLFLFNSLTYYFLQFSIASYYSISPLIRPIDKYIVIINN